jgi:hypothetical protein
MGAEDCPFALKGAINRPIFLLTLALQGLNSVNFITSGNYFVSLHKIIKL